MGGVKSADQIRKALNKAKEENRERRRARQKEIDDLAGKEKLLFEISELKTRIKLCEYDLKGAFKNNFLIEQKHHNLILELNKKEEELRKWDENMLNSSNQQHQESLSQDV